MDATSTVAVLVAVAAGALLLLVLHVWYAIGLSSVFAARGAEPWRAWVPVVNEAEVFRLGGLDPVRAALLLVPGVAVYGLVLKATAANRLGAAVDRGAGTTALAVVLPPLWATLLAAADRPAREEQTVDVVAADAVELAAVTDPVSGPIATVPGVADAAGAGAAAGGRRRSALPAAAPEIPRLPGPVDVPPVAAAHDVPPVAAADDVPPVGAVADRPPVGVPADVALAGAVADVPSVGAVADKPPAGAVADVPPVGAVADRPPVGVPVEPIADAEPVEEETRIAPLRSRRRGDWALTLPDGRVLAVTARTVVLGRKPTADEGVQAVAVVDDTRTVSKQHARLEWTAGGWTITDLDSTNGVTLLPDDVSPERLPTGGSAPVTTRFRLGDAVLEVRPAPRG